MGATVSRLSAWLVNSSNTFTLGSTFALTVVIIVVFQSSLPMTDAALFAISGEHILDTTFYYSSDEALRRISAYGEDGRAVYQRFHIVDFLFAPAYSLALAFLISALQKKGEWIKSAIHFSTPRTEINVLPLLVGLADIIENTCIAMLLALYPDSPSFLASVASSATMLKFLFIVPVVIALLYALVRRFLSPG